MITKDEVMGVILKACPSFTRTWAESEDKELLLYPLMGDLSRHLLTLFQAGSESELIDMGSAIEHLHVNGDDYVKELSTVGILESIQNNWGHANVNPDEFLRYLQPESRKYWHSLNKFWAGEIPYVGFDISRSQPSAPKSSSQSDLP